MLLGFKELDLGGGDNSVNGADEDRFALADAYLSDLPQRRIPSLLHGLTIIEILEPVLSHSSQVVQDLGQWHFRFLADEATACLFQYIFSKGDLCRLKRVLVIILRSS